MPDSRPLAPVPAAASRRRAGWIALALLAAVAAAYAPVWRAGFVWDDDGHVTPPALQPLAGLRRIWFEPNATQQYYPVLHTAFWLEHRLWGDAAAGYHGINLLLHAAAASLLYLLLRRLAVPGAAWAAGLFALHPVAVESVAWVAEQKNTLSAVGYLAAALAYLRFDQSRKRSTYLGASLLFLAALGAKTVTGTLPAALLVVLWWQRGRLGARRDVAPLLPWFAAAAAAGLITTWMERTYVGARGAAFALGWGDRGLLASRVVWFYLSKLCWPHPLIFIYPRWPISAADPAAYLYPLALAAALTAAFAVRRRTRAPLAATLLYVGTLFPALGFINVYPFIYSYVADHFQYLAAAVFFAGAAAAASWATRRWAAGLRAAAAALVLAGLGLLTFRQARTYQDAETLWLTTLAQNPAAAMADQNLGGLYLARGQTDRALPFFQRALALHPEDPEALNEYGVALLQAGQAEAAREVLEHALGLEPNSAEPHLNLGVTLLQLGRSADATAQFEQALALAPQNLKALKNLALARERAGRWNEATYLFGRDLALEPTSVAAVADLAHARRGLAEAEFAHGDVADAERDVRILLAGAPDDPELNQMLGSVLARAGRWGEAAAALATAARLAPDHAEAWAGLALAYFHAGDPARAADALTHALQLQPASAPFHNELGIARAQQGRAAEAAAEFARAVELDPRYEPARRNLERARQSARP